MDYRNIQTIESKDYTPPDYDQWLAVLPYSSEHLELANEIGLVPRHDHWLEDALPFDIYSVSSPLLRGLVNQLYAEIEQIFPLKNRKRYRDALKMVITNLWQAHYCGKAVMYSRDRSYYSQHSRYGELFIKYDRLKNIIDTLETLGYIEQKLGFNDARTGKGRITRMWATPLLWKQFHAYNLKQPKFYTKARPEDLIILKDGSKPKREMKYPTTPAIRRLKDDLERYNEFIQQHRITVDLDASAMVSYEFLANTLYMCLLNNTIKIDHINLFETVGSINKMSISIHRPVVQLFSTKPYNSITTKQYYNQPYHLLNLNTITQRIFPDGLVFRGLREKGNLQEKYIGMLTSYLSDLSYSISMDPDKDRRKKTLQEVFPLKDIGIEQLVLRLDYEYLHRVFNKGSFKLGGRAYGALHQNIPKNFRRLIRIDGEPTVEYDYDAFHIRMLYHKERIDYREDPYVVCEGPEMRDTYKAVGLVAINALENKACGGIYKELEKRGIPLPKRKEPIKSLIRTFRKAHPPIAKYLFNDVGRELQYRDGRIMNAILMRLMNSGSGILGLPVFDSVIATAENEKILRKIMMEEYKKEMKFEASISKKD